LQHKLLLLFVDKKVIVAKVKLCSKGVSNHHYASKPVAMNSLYYGKMEIASKNEEFFQNSAINRKKFTPQAYTRSNWKPAGSILNHCGYWWA